MNTSSHHFHRHGYISADRLIRKPRPPAQLTAHQLSIPAHRPRGQAPRLPQPAEQWFSVYRCAAHPKRISSSPGTATLCMAANTTHIFLPEKPGGSAPGSTANLSKSHGHGSRYRTDVPPPSEDCGWVCTRSSRWILRFLLDAWLAHAISSEIGIATYYNLTGTQHHDGNPTYQHNLRHAQTPFCIEPDYQKPVTQLVHDLAPKSPDIYLKYEVKDEEAMAASLPKFMKKYAPPFDRDANNAPVLLVDELYLEDKFPYPCKNVDARTRHACSIGYPIGQTSRIVAPFLFSTN
ncbi:hypothetical protein IMY05_C4745000300 [Salix suchowensis]|nr:hypothetical protein IMY05_C4745000300 [Salix suchowensis]